MISAEHEIISILNTQALTYSNIFEHFPREAQKSCWRTFYKPRQQGLIQKVPRSPVNFSFSVPSEIIFIHSEETKYQLVLPVDKIKKLLLL